MGESDDITLAESHTPPGWAKGRGGSGRNVLTSKEKHEKF